MKPTHLLVIAVAILGLLSFGCDTGNDDDGSASTVLGETPAISANVDSLDTSTGETTSWDNPNGYVILGVTEGNTIEIIDIDDDGDGSISLSLDAPTNLAPVTVPFEGMDISNEDAEVTYLSVVASTSTEDYQNNETELGALGVYVIPDGGLSSESIVEEWQYWYADVAVTITGTDTNDDGSSYEVNVSLQPGWNIVYTPFMGQGYWIELTSKSVSANAEWLYYE